MLVVIDSQEYSFPVSASVAVMMYLRITPFWFSDRGGFQFKVTEVESTTWPVRPSGAVVGAKEKKSISLS